LADAILVGAVFGTDNRVLTFEVVEALDIHHDRDDPERSRTSEFAPTVLKYALVSDSHRSIAGGVRALDGRKVVDVVCAAVCVLWRHVTTLRLWSAQRAWSTLAFNTGMN
jgi:hypothetical protein